MVNKHGFYLSLVDTISLASYAKRNKVGALLEKEGNIIAFGYNGTPHGFPNECEMYEPPLGMVTKPEVLHAESNAIAKCAKSVHSSSGCTLYTTMSPCVECAKLIIQAGIVRVVYRNLYRNIDGLQLLDRAGIPHQKYEPSEH